MKEDDKLKYYKIELPAPWNCEIKEERAGSDGRVFLGEEYTGVYALWVVDPEIKLEGKPRKDYTLYFTGKVNGTDSGISQALSNGRVTVGGKHAHKKVLMLLFKEELTDVEISILEDMISSD
ncbi:MAG: hypothetical protein R6U17_09485 [Thermoplasmata archaeon]